MDIKKIESFLTKLSSGFRRFFVDMRLQYDYSDDGTLVQVTLSRISGGSGVSLVPKAIFSITGTSVRFLKLDLSSKVQFADYQVTTPLELRSVILNIVYDLVHVDRHDLSLFEFLSKIFQAKITNPQSYLAYLLTLNEVPFMEDGTKLFVYGYGNVGFFEDAISFFSTQSSRAVYKIDSESSAYNVVGLLLDGVWAFMVAEDETLIEDPILFKGESMEDPEPEEVQEDDGLGGFGDTGGGFDDFGGGDLGGGGGSNSIPVEGDSGGMGGMTDLGVE